ncbi:hypothetical protein BU23DRAFT_303884 [Bimuria novae-zelandiae CBS 107.79]|uniref:Uncharacterized protein n=1 Tax=Bimuria novae-zelandiae CBS 107.79 TaxID=1447943 RepID=A0A6A5V1C0_9PLEO|nr:hypothetical protein BU23DRAFT_303884 [Bimuria novae-zelandiae CBS 107.79]
MTTQKFFLRLGMRLSFVPQLGLCIAHRKIMQGIGSGLLSLGLQLLWLTTGLVPFLFNSGLPFIGSWRLTPSLHDSCNIDCSVCDDTGYERDAIRVAVDAVPPLIPHSGLLLGPHARVQEHI